MWKMARMHVIRPREKLDRWLLHIGMVDLVIEGYSEDRSALGRCPGRTAIAVRIGTASSTPRGLNSAKGRSIWAQLRRDDRKLYGISVVDWISSRIGLITSRFLDLR
jgi:hypothetical protein